MYVSSTAPLPPNSMNTPSPPFINQRKVNAINAASVVARAIVECPPDPWAFLSLGKNLAADVETQTQEVASTWQNPLASGALLPAASIPGNSLADPPVNSPAVVTTPITVASIQQALRNAPKAIPLTYGQPQVSGCDIVIPLPSQQPRTQIKPVVIMPSAAPQTAPATVQQQPNQPVVAPPLPASSAPPAPSASPCPPGVPFQGRYIFGAPVCGAMPTGGVPAAGGGFQRAYASIVPTGMHDTSPWGNAQNPSGGGGAGSKRSTPLGVWLFIGLGLFALGRKG